MQAVLGTLAVFASALVAYKSGKIRATPKFKRTVLVAMGGYLIFALVNMVVVLTGHGGTFGLQQGGLGIAIGLFAVGLAAMMLILDFDFADQGVRNGVPERYSWLAAFGLVVTLVWLYVEMLRLHRDHPRRLTAATSRAATRYAGSAALGVSAPGWCQPATFGPARSIAKRTSTRCWSAIACPVLVPVGVLAGDPPVVVDEQVEGLGPLDDLRGALDLGPVAVEAVVEDAQRDARVAAQVACTFIDGLPGGDLDPALVVDPGGHRGELRAAVAPEGREHGGVVGAQELPRLVGRHRGRWWVTRAGGRRAGGRARGRSPRHGRARGRARRAAS